jgi:hypothetical protein
MARSPGNATLSAVSPTSALFAVSMPASSYGRLAAVTRPSCAPSGVDIDKPSVARVSDCYRGVSHNVAYDEMALFTGERPIEPGVIQIPYWRPDQPDDLDADVARCPGYAGVARID